MNKGIGIGVVVAIVIAAIGAYAFFGISEDESLDQSAGIGMSDVAEVEVTQPSEAEPEEVETLPSEAEDEQQGATDELGIKDEAEVEAVPPPVTATGEERIGVKPPP